MAFLFVPTSSWRSPPLFIFLRMPAAFLRLVRALWGAVTRCRVVALAAQPVRDVTCQCKPASSVRNLEQRHRDCVARDGLAVRARGPVTKHLDQDRRRQDRSELTKKVFVQVSRYLVVRLSQNLAVVHAAALWRLVTRCYGSRDAGASQAIWLFRHPSCAVGTVPSA